jgi:hypothetical protein
MIRKTHEDCVPFRRRTTLRIFVVAILLLVASSAGVAENRKPTEYEVKAAYLFNFGQFIKWESAKAPPTPDSFTVCVLGSDPFDGTLDAVVKGGTINNRPVTVKRLGEAGDATRCQILFVSTSEAARASKILHSLDSLGVLTVSDMPHFCESGGMIQFVQQGDKIRFEVNLSATNGAGLTLSAELLKLATKVIRGSDGTGV